ncbi:SSU ribosomal protein S6p [hydrothermal vent metagenome]|uniref:SSU ribosomal protein S6p n=1 Tax=hydrothermal vent metagenome TaxID=652676 RepID=A0A3B0RZE5_9ZZZZ
MSLYEHIFMVRQDASNAQVESLTEQFRTVITENEGSIEKHEYWGIKPLAYKVKKNRKAHFTLMNISAPHAAVAEMERQMTLSDDVIRFLTLRVDEHEEGPSVMMRDDRPRRDTRPPRKSFDDKNKTFGDKKDEDKKGDDS